MLNYWLSVFLIFPNTQEYKDVCFPRGGVASNSPISAEVGRDMLANGGSAVDAAIATLFCGGVVLPHCMGIGGGFLMNIYDYNTKTATTLNARETAPAAATEDMFDIEPELSKRGALSTAVPGEIRGYWSAHQRYGVLPWKQLIKPAIKLARHGYEVTPFLESVLKQQKENLKNDPGLRKLFINSRTGKPCQSGQFLKNCQLADTLEIIAEEGERAFYDSELTDCFVRDIQKLNGIITIADMKNYTPIWCSTLTTRLPSDKTLYTVRPPGSGATLILMLNILNGFVQTRKLNTVANWHRIIEAFKFGYGARTQLGDPISSSEVNEWVEILTDKEYANYLRSKILKNETVNHPAYYGSNVYVPEDHGTCNVSVIAPNGDAVAVTSTLNLYFGACALSESTGIVLNNEMNNFCVSTKPNSQGLPPSTVNLIKPGKRPLSSMSPTIIVDKRGHVNLVIGAGGGSKITSSVALVTLRNIFFDEPIGQAVAETRILPQLHPMQISAETGFSQEILAGLSEWGHAIEKTKPLGVEAVTALSRRRGTIEGSFDPRRGGGVALF